MQNLVTWKAKQARVACLQQGANVLSVEANERLDNGIDIRVAANNAQLVKHIDSGLRRKHQIARHPAIDGKQADGHASGIEADAQQMPGIEVALWIAQQFGEPGFTCRSQAMAPAFFCANR